MIFRRLAVLLIVLSCLAPQETFSRGGGGGGRGMGGGMRAGGGGMRAGGIRGGGMRAGGRGGVGRVGRTSFGGVGRGGMRAGGVRGGRVGRTGLGGVGRGGIGRGGRGIGRGGIGRGGRGFAGRGGRWGRGGGRGGRWANGRYWYGGYWYPAVTAFALFPWLAYGAYNYDGYGDGYIDNSSTIYDYSTVVPEAIPVVGAQANVDNAGATEWTIYNNTDRTLSVFNSNNEQVTVQPGEEVDLSHVAGLSMNVYDESGAYIAAFDNVFQHYVTLQDANGQLDYVRY